MWRLKTFVLFSLTSLHFASAIAIPSPDIFFTEEMVEEYKLYKLWLDNCTQFDEMPYYDETSETYDCYPIMSVGPCTPGEWFVLNENNPKRAICVVQPCACQPVIIDNSKIQPELDSDDCEFNYDEDDLVYYTHVEYEGNCQEIQDPSSCPSFQELLPSPFGIGKSK